MTKVKRTAAATIGVAAALTASIGMTGTAHAYTPEGVCGSGYTIRASAAIGEGPNARVYLLRNGNTACVVTFKTGGSVGNNVSINAWVEGGPGTLRGDTGRYKYYAGPVKVTDSCVNWGGHYGEYWWKNTPC
ncbi:hypothetical protein [Actinomadura sediminis]|uniref:Serine/threonine protein kinase n=1 Tax=Actinomadura sediminis TaxID=1038904 RepID=A0ABW3F142_9ACTN